MKGYRLFLIITSFLFFVSIIILIGESFLVENQVPEKQAFQAALGGVGLGAVRVPAWNIMDYDPRLQSLPFDRVYPIPGGYGYSPDRLTAVSAFPENFPK